MDKYPSFTNKLDIGEDSVTKTFTPWGSIKTAMLSSVYQIKYSGSRERYEREKDALETLGEKGILVPQIMDYDNDGKTIVTKKIDNENLKFRLRRPEAHFDDRINDLNTYLSVLKSIHEAGCAHGDPAPQNFGFSNAPQDSDELYSFDFEHETKFDNMKDKQNADLSCALMCSASYLSDSLEKGDITPILEAMKKSYGTTPKPVGSLFMFSEFNLPNRTSRPDLYRAIMKSK
jgi:tRNA A-37 threonylcarbamoyl transferase component Bud32